VRSRGHPGRGGEGKGGQRRDRVGCQGEPGANEPPQVSFDSPYWMVVPTRTEGRAPVPGRWPNTPYGTLMRAGKLLSRSRADPAATVVACGIGTFRRKIGGMVRKQVSRQYIGGVLSRILARDATPTLAVNGVRGTLHPGVGRAPARPCSTQAGAVAVPQARASQLSCDDPGLLPDDRGQRAGQLFMVRYSTEPPAPKSPGGRGPSTSARCCSAQTTAAGRTRQVDAEHDRRCGLRGRHRAGSGTSYTRQECGHGPAAAR